MRKILIVDDISTNRKLLRGMLLCFEFDEILEASNGINAIEVFKDNQPDIILMDIDMPRMNGYSAAKKIKVLSGEDYVPIIFITASTEEASLSKSLDCGGDDFLSKPFNAAVLESKIRAHLRIRKLNQEINQQNAKLSIINTRLGGEQYLIERFFKNLFKQNYRNEKLVKYFMSSMTSFSGDVFLTEKDSNGSLYVLIGDFTGHGLTAAMGTFPVAQIFFEMSRESSSISNMVRKLNALLYVLMPTEIFFAATLITLNKNEDCIDLWSGGMPEMYIVDADGNTLTEVFSKHMALGILNNEEFDGSSEHYSVNQGDQYYFYSDGVVETESPSGELFGNDRLKDILLSNEGDRISVVKKELDSFRQEALQNDDITLVELTCQNHIL